MPHKMMQTKITHIIPIKFPEKASVVWLFATEIREGCKDHIQLFHKLTHFERSLLLWEILSELVFNLLAFCHTTVVPVIDWTTVWGTAYCTTTKLYVFHTLGPNMLWFTYLITFIVGQNFSNSRCQFSKTDAGTIMIWGWQSLSSRFSSSSQSFGGPLVLRYFNHAKKAIVCAVFPRPIWTVK